MCPFTVRVPRRLSLADFLGSLITCTIGLSEDAPYYQVRIGMWICLHSSTSTPFNELFRQFAALSLLRPHITLKGSNGILTISAIDIAFRRSLRTRLTLIRLALIRKPESFGEGVSRPLYRYLYLHLRFHTLQRSLRFAFNAEWNAPLPTINGSIASVNRLCPIIIHAKFLD